MNTRPEGLLVPITTPFDAATGDVAPVLLRENARTMLDLGTAGIVAAGSTGEASMLSEAEFGSVVEWLRDIVPDERWLIAGAGRESTRASVAACDVAAERGADGVLVRAPSYYGPVFTEASLIDHFRAIADQSPIPVILYNFPRYTHVPLTPRCGRGDCCGRVLCDRTDRRDRYRLLRGRCSSGGCSPGDRGAPPQNRRGRARRAGDQGRDGRGGARGWSAAGADSRDRREGACTRARPADGGGTRPRIAPAPSTPRCSRGLQCRGFPGAPRCRAWRSS